MSVPPPPSSPSAARIQIYTVVPSLSPDACRLADYTDDRSSTVASSSLSVVSVNLRSQRAACSLRPRTLVKVHYSKTLEPPSFTIDDVTGVASPLVVALDPCAPSPRCRPRQKPCKRYACVVSLPPQPASPCIRCISRTCGTPSQNPRCNHRGPCHRHVDPTCQRTTL